MNDTQTASPTKLVIRRTIAAERSSVFEAWTKPAVLQQWFGPGDYSIAEAHLDARVGGTYRIWFAAPDGERFAVAGVFRDVKEPERLQCTWRWEEDDAALEHESLLTVDFLVAGAGTELVLTHERLADEASRDRHLGGWGESLAQLAALLETN